MDQQVLDKAKEIALKHGKLLAVELVELVLVPALDEAVKKSATPIDDIVWAGIKDEAIKKLHELVG